MEKKTYSFNIAGVPYKIKTSLNEEVVNELVEFVNDKMNQAMSSTKNSSFQSAAVLAAMNIAEELFLLKKKAYKEMELIEQRALRLATELESSKIQKALEN
ncbi:MAG TPA: cell division protein ZapA [Pseudobdellovibrionaceae bacterium]|nr:cell division protein ZapA [Pseudobdellovibrionaceae bacterium]